jgi:hypothetical protein
MVVSHPHQKYKQTLWRIFPEQRREKKYCLAALTP